MIAFLKKNRGILLGLLLLATLIFLVRLLPVASWLTILTEYAKEAGPFGLLLFVAFYVAACLFFIPGSLITLAAGATFGLWKGVVAVSLGSTLGAGLAFLLARTLLRNRVERWAGESKNYAAIEGAVEEGGWKIVGLFRISPAIPFSMSNYLFGLTPVRFWPYLSISWLAMLPGTFLYVYLGMLGRDGAKVASGGGGRSGLEWAMLGVGLLATILVTVYVTKLAKRELAAKTV